MFLLGGDFLQFLKWSHFSNISCFYELFLHGTTAMCCRNIFSMFFFYFKFLTQSDDFAKAIALAWWLFFENFKMVLFFQY